MGERDNLGLKLWDSEALGAVRQWNSEAVVLWYSAEEGQGSIGAVMLLGSSVRQWYSVAMRQ